MDVPNSDPLFEDEKGVETVQELLERAKKEEVAIFVCFATFTEVFYITFREQGQEEARKRVKLMSRLAITSPSSRKEKTISHKVANNYLFLCNPLLIYSLFVKESSTHRKQSIFVVVNSACYIPLYAVAYYLL